MLTIVEQFGDSHRPMELLTDRSALYITYFGVENPIFEDDISYLSILSIKIDTDEWFTLPSWVKRCTNLQHVSLKGFKALNLFLDQFPSSVQTLTLHGQFNPHVLRGMENFVHLTTFDLRCWNHFDLLPEYDKDSECFFSISGRADIDIIPIQNTPLLKTLVLHQDTFFNMSYIFQDKMDECDWWWIEEHNKQYVNYKSQLLHHPLLALVQHLVTSIEFSIGDYQDLIITVHLDQAVSNNLAVASSKLTLD